MKYLPVLLILTIPLVMAVSGCTQIDEVLPKDETFTIMNIPYAGDMIYTEDCIMQFELEYPDKDNFDCQIKSVDLKFETFSCLCTVHTGVI